MLLMLSSRRCGDELAGRGGKVSQPVVVEGEVGDDRPRVRREAVSKVLQGITH